MAIKTVAVIGASGNVGAPTVQALLAAGFTVTAITRPSSTSTFPPTISVRRADLTSLSSLTAAFAGIDAVVTAITTAEVGNQLVLADAALAAGVSRFIPSEFGHNTGKLSGGLAAILTSKAKTVEYLKQLAKQNPGFNWTAIATSAFFDWGLDNGIFGLDLKARSVRVIDSGEELVSTSSLAFVAQAITQVLLHEEQTRNVYLDVVEFNVSQNQVVRIFEEELGEKFMVEHIKGADLEKRGNEKLEKGDFWGAFYDLLLSWNFSDGGNRALEKGTLANEMLGLKAGDVREVIRDYIKTRA